MKKTAHRVEEVAGGGELRLKRRRNQRGAIGPGALLVEGGDQRQPAGDVLIAQPAGTLLHVGFEMKDGVAELGLPGAGEFGNALHQRLPLAAHQPWQKLVVELAEERAIAGQKAGVEQGERAFDVVGVEAVTLARGARGRTDAQPGIPQLAAEGADLLLDLGIRRLGAEKQQVNVGVREKLGAPESPDGGQGEAGRIVAEQVAPKTDNHVADQFAALADGDAPVAGELEGASDAGRLAGVKLIERAAGRCRGHGNTSWAGTVIRR